MSHCVYKNKRMPFWNDYRSVIKEVLTLSLSKYETKEHPQKRNTSCLFVDYHCSRLFHYRLVEKKKNDKKFVISIYQRLRSLSSKGFLQVCFNNIVLDDAKLDPAKEGNVSDTQIFCLLSYFYTHIATLQCLDNKLVSLVFLISLLLSYLLALNCVFRTEVIKCLDLYIKIHMLAWPSVHFIFLFFNVKS